MTGHSNNPKVDFFFLEAKKWKNEYERLRTIALDCGLQEELKWGCPCYTYRGSNIVLIHGFKNYCAYLFHKGSLLKDTHNLLVQQTPNVQSARQIRFTNSEEISNQEPILKSYIHEAIEAEKAGLKVEFRKTSEYHIPDEFQKAMDEDPRLKSAFEALTPGRQRGYLLFFSQPKQSKTKRDRIERNIENIINGKGLNDR